MKKKTLFGLLSVFLAVLLLVPSVSCVQAAGSVPKVTDYITDDADILSSSTISSLDALGKSLYEKTGAQVVAVTIDSLDGQSAASLATAIGNEAKVGSGDADNGVVILVAVQDREYFVAVGSGLEGDITDIEASHLAEDYLVPYFKDGDYDGGITALYKAIANEISPGIANSTTDIHTPSRYEEDSGLGLGGILLIFIILLAIVFAIYVIVHKDNGSSGSASRAGYSLQPVTLTLGEHWQMHVPGYDFDKDNIVIYSNDPNIVQAAPGGWLTAVNLGSTTVTLQKSGEERKTFPVEVVKSGGYSSGRNDELLTGLLLGSLLGRMGRRRYYGPYYGPGVFGPAPRRNNRPPRGPRGGGFGGTGGFGGFGGGHSGGGFHGGGGGFRGGGAGGKW